MKKLPLLLLLSFSFVGLAYADTREPFLEAIKGVVKLDFSDSSMYEGQVEECLIGGKHITCFKGMGVYTFKTGYRYEGEFKDNKPMARVYLLRQMVNVIKVGLRTVNSMEQGVMNYPDGRRYEGEYKDNKRDGYGIMTYQDGGIFRRR